MFATNLFCNISLTQALIFNWVVALATNQFLKYPFFVCRVTYPTEKILNTVVAFSPS